MGLIVVENVINTFHSNESNDNLDKVITNNHIIGLMIINWPNILNLMHDTRP